MVEGANLLLYCLFCASIAHFLQMCYESEMLLRRYYLYLVYLWIRNRSKKRRKFRGILKPLGLCIYCQAFWVNVILYPLFFPIDQFFLLSIGGVYLCIELIFKIKWHYENKQNTVTRSTVKKYSHIYGELLTYFTRKFQFLRSKLQ